MSTPQELRQVSLLGRPDVAVFTNVRAVHLQAFDSLQAIADAKAELLAGLAPGGIVIANADDPLVRGIAARHEGEVVWYGRGDADVRARDERPAPQGETGTRLVVETDDESAAVELPLHGAYNVDNFLAAAACAVRLGVPLADIAVAVRSVEPQPMRGVVHRLSRGTVVVDDSYNSNPDAATQAMQAAKAIASGRYWAVLGDMLELGETEAELHRQVGRAAAELGFSPVFGVGPLAADLVEEARREGAVAEWYETADAAAEAAARTLCAGDLLLVKGSRGIGLEAVVQRVLEEAN